MKVQVTNTGQVTVTIPRSIARALSLHQGDELIVQLNRTGSIELRKVQ